MKGKVIYKIKIKDILFVILLIIPFLLLIINPIIISIWYSNPLWLSLYLLLPVEIFAFYFYYVIINELLFK